MHLRKVGASDIANEEGIAGEHGRVADQLRKDQLALDIYDEVLATSPDGVERELKTDMLVIADATLPDTWQDLALDREADEGFRGRHVAVDPPAPAQPAGFRRLLTLGWLLADK